MHMLPEYAFWISWLCWPSTLADYDFGSAGCLCLQAIIAGYALCLVAMLHKLAGHAGHDRWLSCYADVLAGLDLRLIWRLLWLNWIAGYAT